jgi:SAM-dependent methyltransferase
MINGASGYIKNWFIDLKWENLKPSFYVIRRSLLKAVSELKPMVKGKVVDLGCGVMPYKEYLSNPEIESYIGIDLEPTIYHNSITPDLYWDGLIIPLEDSSCDFVIATEFLEHYFDTEHIIKEIKRVLKPGGILFFTVPAIWPVHESPYDYHRFTPYSLIEYFKTTEFSSWEIRPLGGFHYSVALMLSLWNDYKLSKKKQKLIKPFLRLIVMYLLKKDIINPNFGNDQFYSGLYGFVTK